MDARNHALDSERAELYLMLARAFLAPREETLARAMHDVLADDLADAAAQLGLDVTAPIAELRRELALLPEPLELLQVYSAIFLAPPVAACINAGQYLDRARDGGSVREMEQAYRLCGVQRDEGFRDLSDHIAVQLEFAALLYATRAEANGARRASELPVEPGAFLHRYALRWIDGLVADLERAAADKALRANPYRPLALIVRQAVRADAVAPEVDAKLERKRRAIESARAKAAARGIDAEQLEEIRCKLRERGLATEHVRLPDAADRPPPRPE